jgi:protein-disulfide isomerase
MHYLKNIFVCALLGIFSSAYGEDFSIGEPSQIITPKMMAESRTNAVAHADALLREPDDVIVGNPNGVVTMVQFVDFMCPHSEMMDRDLQILIEGNPDLRVIYKPYPLRGKISSDAVEAALAAYQQGKYLPYHVLLMQNGKGLTDEKIISLAKVAGLNVQAIQKAIQTSQYSTQIQAARKLAGEIGIPGTPALFFAKTNLAPGASSNNIIFLLGVFSEDDLQNAVDKMMK